MPATTVEICLIMEYQWGCLHYLQLILAVLSFRYSFSVLVYRNGKNFLLTSCFMSEVIHHFSALISLSSIIHSFQKEE